MPKPRRDRDVRVSRPRRWSDETEMFENRLETETFETETTTLVGDGPFVSVLCAFITRPRKRLFPIRIRPTTKVCVFSSLLHYRNPYISRCGLMICANANSSQVQSYTIFIKLLTST